VLLVANTVADPAYTQPSSIKGQFKQSIFKGCLKTKGNSEKLCYCYSTRISSRYTPTQSIAIYRLSKSSDEARKMFFLAHSPDYNKCKQIIQ